MLVAQPLCLLRVFAVLFTACTDCHRLGVRELTAATGLSVVRSTKPTGERRSYTPKLSAAHLTRRSTVLLVVLTAQSQGMNLPPTRVRAEHFFLLELHISPFVRQLYHTFSSLQPYQNPLFRTPILEGWLFLDTSTYLLRDFRRLELSGGTILRGRKGEENVCTHFFFTRFKGGQKGSKRRNHTFSSRSVYSAYMYGVEMGSEEKVCGAVFGVLRTA